MACYGDPDYWLGGLLLAFDAHQFAPPSRAGGLPVVLGSPDNDKQRQGTITDLQLNVPPAAAVALLAGRAYHNPLRPETAFRLDDQGRPVIQGQVPQSSPREWAKAARSAPVEAARVVQDPG